MNQRRSAGRLHIGKVFYSAGHFNVDMVFESATHFPGEDENKSAALAARQHFYRLLFENGFQTHETPDVYVTPNGARSLSILLSCKASRQKVDAIKVYDQDAIVRPVKKTNEAGNKMD